MQRMVSSQPREPRPDASGGPPDRILGLQFQSLTLPSGEIAYVDEGEGPTVLLLHGAPLTALGFVRVIRTMRAHYRVIAPDLPGFGRSRPAPGFDGSLAAYARFVEDFCRALELRAFFVYLNDSSACIGLPALASLAPEIAGIVVASTVPLPLTGAARVVKFGLEHVVSSAPIRILNRRYNLLPWLVVTIAPFLAPFPAAERAVLRGQFDTPAKRDRILDVFAQMGRDDSFMRAAAERARTHLSETPALLLYGQLDPMRFIGAVGRFKRLFRRHAVRIIRFEEHFPILASGARVAETMHAWIVSLGRAGETQA